MLAEKYEGLFGFLGLAEVNAGSERQWMWKGTMRDER